MFLFDDTLFISLLYLTVNLVDNLVAKFVFRYYEYGEQKQYGWDYAYQPQDTLLSQGSLLRQFGIEANPCKYQTRNNTT